MTTTPTDPDPGSLDRMTTADLVAMLDQFTPMMTSRASVVPYATTTLIDDIVLTLDERGRDDDHGVIQLPLWAYEDMDTRIGRAIARRTLTIEGRFAPETIAVTIGGHRVAVFHVGPWMTRDEAIAAADVVATRLVDDRPWLIRRPGLA